MVKLLTSDTAERPHKNVIITTIIIVFFFPLRHDIGWLADGIYAPLVLLSSHDGLTRDSISTVYDDTIATIAGFTRVSVVTS